MSWKIKILFFLGTVLIILWSLLSVGYCFFKCLELFCSILFSIRMTMLLQSIMPRKSLLSLWGSSVPLGCEGTKCTRMWWGFGTVFTSGSVWLSGSWKYHWVWFPIYFDLIDKQLTSVTWKRKRKVKWSWRGEHRVILWPKLQIDPDLIHYDQVEATAGKIFLKGFR